MKEKAEYSLSSLLATASSITLAAAAPMTAAGGGRMYHVPVAQRLCVAHNEEDIEEAVAMASLERITPTNERLKQLAAQSPPPAEWFRGEEEDLF